MIPLAVIGLCQFVFIFLKSFQQRNVAFDHDAWVAPTSFAMAATEVFVTAQIAYLAVNNGILEAAVAIVPLGIGGALGSLGAMRLHRALHGGHSSSEEQKARPRAQGLPRG